MLNFSYKYTLFLRNKSYNSTLFRLSVSTLSPYSCIGLHVRGRHSTAWWSATCRYPISVFSLQSDSRLLKGDKPKRRPGSPQRHAALPSGRPCSCRKGNIARLSVCRKEGSPDWLRPRYVVGWLSSRQARPRRFRSLGSGCRRGCSSSGYRYC